MKNYKYLLDVDDTYEDESAEMNYEEQLLIRKKKKNKKLHDECSKEKSKKLNKPHRYHKEYED